MIANGIVGCITNVKQNSCLLGAFLGLSISSLILSTTMAAMHSWYLVIISKDSRAYYWTDRKHWYVPESHYEAAVGVSGFLVGLIVVELVCSIIAVVLALKPYCKCCTTCNLDDCCTCTGCCDCAVDPVRYQQYKNKFVRLNCWRKIGEKFGIEPAEAEKKYKNVRTVYGRYLKKGKSVPSGSGRDAVQPPPAEFANLEWLGTYISQRGDTITNMPSSVFLDESMDETEPQEESASETGLIDDIAEDKQLDDAVNSNKDQVKDTLTVELDAKETVDDFQLKCDKKSVVGKFINKSTTPKLKKPYAANNKKNATLYVDTILSKTATSLAEKVLQSPEEESKLHNEMDDDEDSLFCRSVAKRGKTNETAPASHEGPFEASNRANDV
eukprot:Seg1353.6 transcript_id=Seg1353.6/GoldUCD/mRNA.D3Y31 product="hypothetical protein" protein_id=Seg1353.6/GoldUCD/D3Y31